MDSDSSSVAHEVSRRYQSHYRDLSLQDVFSDLASRFVINLPPEELGSIERICFQVEQCHWFYEDFIKPHRPDLPSLTLRRFSELFLTACKPHAAFTYDPITAYDSFLQYKSSIPVRGAILLNRNWDKVLLVKGWKASAAWGFPRGKINKGEADRDCAVREVWEETGYDISPHFDPSLSPHAPTEPDAPPPLVNRGYVDERPDDYIDLILQEQQVRLYVVPGLSESTHFETRTRKEISRIAWFPLKELPGWSKNADMGMTGKGRFYLVTPVVKALKVWLSKHRPSKKLSQQAAGASSHHSSPSTARQAYQDPAFVDVDEGTRALQNFFLSGPPDVPQPAGPSTLPVDLERSQNSTDAPSTGLDSIANDAEDHFRQQRRKQLLRGLDDMLNSAGSSSGGSASNGNGSPSGSRSSHQHQHRDSLPGPSTSSQHSDNDILASLFSAAAASGSSSRSSFPQDSNGQHQQHQQHQQTYHHHNEPSPHVSQSFLPHQYYQSSGPPTSHVSPPHLYSPQPQYPSPLAVFESKPEPSPEYHMHPGHHLPTPPYHSQAPPHGMPFSMPMSSQPPPPMPAPPPPQMAMPKQAQPLPPNMPIGVDPNVLLSQPIPLRPIPLLTSFQSPPPVMPKSNNSSQSIMPQTDPQQQANLLDLLNGTTSGPPPASTSQPAPGWNMPNYPSGSPNNYYRGIIT